MQPSKSAQGHFFSKEVVDMATMVELSEYGSGESVLVNFDCVECITGGMDGVVGSRVYFKYDADVEEACRYLRISETPADITCILEDMASEDECGRCEECEEETPDTEKEQGSENVN
jgi:hypothetical protein